MTAADQLTIETLDAARQALAASTGSARVVVGIACCPQTAARLKQFRKPSFPSWGVPLLIDVRIMPGRSEVYYDEKLWRERCREQATYDAETSGPNVGAEPRIPATKT